MSTYSPPSSRSPSPSPCPLPRHPPPTTPATHHPSLPPPSTPTVKVACPFCPHKQPFTALGIHLSKVHREGVPVGGDPGPNLTWCQGTWYTGQQSDAHRSLCNAHPELSTPLPIPTAFSPLRTRASRLAGVAGNGDPSIPAPNAPTTSAPAATQRHRLPLCGDELSDSDLRLYPTRHRLHYSSSVRRAYKRCLGRLAPAFTEAPSEATLRPIVLLPKMTVAAFSRHGPRAVVDALDSYPYIPTPPPPSAPQASAVEYPSLSARVRRLVRQGRLSAAAKALNSAPVAEDGPETEEALRKLHPGGPANPFSGDSPRRPTSRVKPETIMKALASFNRGTAAGLDGWTVPLLSTALEDDAVKEAFVVLAGLMLDGTAPCKSLLCASTLTPLVKAGGGVRPIAVGSLLYRLVTKAILRQFPLADDALLPFQLGVGSRGGVEPMILWLQRAIDSGLPAAETSADLGAEPEEPAGTTSAPSNGYITSLDFSNAFNALDRTLVADGVRDRAPHLFKLVAWAYNDPSSLFTRAAASLRSSQGVRQGDPLGPALFSLAIADLLRDLDDYLGPAYHVMAYLDDICILGPGPALDKAEAFLAARNDPLCLNRAKCNVSSFEDVRIDGLDVLGGHIGPLSTRQSFLERKIDAEQPALDALSRLPSQEALILLRSCLQHTTSHLLRSVDPDGAEAAWIRRDTDLLAALADIRGRPHADFTPVLLLDPVLDAELATLPARLGGLGLLSHVERAPHARAAAMELAAQTLATRLERAEPDSVVSTHSRCAPLISDRYQALWANLDDDRRVALVENGSLLGRRWLTVLPLSDALQIPDAEVSAGLYCRALAGPRPGPLPSACLRCNVTPKFGHVDTCTVLNTSRTSAHEQIKYAVARALGSLPDSSVTVEPFIRGQSDRNDIALVARQSCPLRSAEYDVSTVALTAKNGRSVPAVRKAKRSDTLTDVRKRVEAALDLRAAKKRRKQAPATVFIPLIISGGGLMLDDTHKRCFVVWKRTMTSLVYQHLVDRVSCALLSRRVSRRSLHYYGEPDNDEVQV